MSDVNPLLERAVDVERMSAARRVAWSLEACEVERLALTTGFGMEGCALIDMYARHGQPLDVIYLDTEFLFQETYELRDRLAERYHHLRFVGCKPLQSPSQQAASFGNRLWERDPDLCCRLRKTDPLRAALDGSKLWVTGLRRDQSAERSSLRVLSWDASYRVAKLSPLAEWSRAAVWSYVECERVPFNALHQRGYPTLGCTHCTRAVAGHGPGDYSRAGRWPGRSKTECGLHLAATAEATSQSHSC